MESLLAALGHRDRLRILLWLVSGPMRQVELVRRLETQRRRVVNPGEVSALLKPLFAAGMLTRDRPRGPIAVVQREQLVRLLQSAAALSLAQAESEHAEVANDSAELRRAVLQQLPESTVAL
jgi:DNA-binding transcriptional ArsR family regulator